MKTKHLFFSALCANGFLAQAQVDSLTIANENTIMEEIVITTQLEPQSLKRSINNVRIISEEDIRNLGAVNLGDVLNQYINITVTPSGNSGRSTVSMFGLNASYFKILIDNIPIVNEGGLGNNTDLSQINLNDIERIEIIEGAMGVTHGANAVSGILNIITKKSARHKWEIALTAQEETVGKEFAFFDKGRHIQAIKINHNINENWFASMGVNRSDFQGFMEDLNGKDHLINDGKRGYKWLPKEQLQGNALVNYHQDNLRVFYKFEFMNEEVDFYRSSVQSGYNDDKGAYKYGDDERYFSNRLYQHLNASGKLFKQINFNISVSHQMQKRDKETFRYDITNNLENNNNRIKDQEMQVLYSTGTFSNFFDSNKVNLQFGYEITNNKGFAVVDEEANRKKEIKENIDNYDFFAVSEITINDRFSIRPGIRYSFQTIFENQYAYSFGGRYLMDKGFEARAALGKSYRTPNFYELYSKMIFDGHYFLGNENLIPEKSNSLEVSIKKMTNFEKAQQPSMLSNNIMISYNNIQDRITSAVVGYEGATPVFQNINISKYRSINLSTTNQFMIDNWNFNLGASVTWVSQLIDNMEFKTTDDYFAHFNLNANVSYKLPKWNTTFSAYYKFIGKAQQWEIGNKKYEISTTESYGLLDASIRKAFWNNKFEATIGARNILNVTDLLRSNLNNGGGHEVSNYMLLAYGRSYFLKLTYNFNFN